MCIRRLGKNNSFFLTTWLKCQQFPCQLLKNDMFNCLTTNLLVKPGFPLRNVLACFPTSRQSELQ